ncbi:MAG: serine/threonine-protein kinase [Polyangia bacterium]
MGEERIGSYRIVRKLGQGGMGEVFEAVHETIERRVAIKLLRPERARNAAAAARFFNEARAVNRIDHPGLVQVSDYGETPEGSIYIVMELLRGETLGQRLARRGRLALGEVLLLCRQVASVLVAVHEKGIIHRDLKPDNMMFVPDPDTAGGERVKLLDFGIAKLTLEGDAARVRTSTDMLIGTPVYMSPENRTPKLSDGGFPQIGAGD